MIHLCSCTVAPIGMDTASGIRRYLFFVAFVSGAFRVQMSGASAIVSVSVSVGFRVMQLLISGLLWGCWIKCDAHAMTVSIWDI